MKTKTCSKCEIEKDINEFYKNKTHKDGLTSQCKECCKLGVKKYKQNNKEKVLEGKKRYRETNKQQAQEYRDNHRKELREYDKRYYKKNKKRCKEYYKWYYQLHKEEIIIKIKKYQDSHKTQRNNRRNKRKKNNINFKILGNLRARIRSALSRNTKSLSTMFLIGCSVEYLMYYLQCKFVKGMNWGNHGNGYNGKKEWQIDHIKPCASFDLSKPEEQKKCFHYTNLQPLWAKDNRKKGNKYVL